MEQLYEKYTNIQLFALKYRKFTLVDKEFYDYETFKNKMHTFEYIMHTFDNPKTPDNKIDIYLFKHDSRYISNTIQFKKILDRYSTNHNIIMITKDELNVYRKKMISQYQNLNIKNYLFKNFIIEINKGPLCSVHTILTPDEVRTVCYNLRAHGHKLPAIFENDPQNIWIGGEINDLIKIESYSEITGKTINYRIVTPSSGKIIQNPKSIIDNKPITKINKVQKIGINNDNEEIDNEEIDNEEIDNEEIDNEDFNDEYDE